MLGRDDIIVFDEPKVIGSIDPALMDTRAVPLTVMIGASIPPETELFADLVKVRGDLSQVKTRRDLQPDETYYLCRAEIMLAL